MCHDCRLDDDDDNTIARMLSVKGITVKYNDDKMLKYYTVKVEGFFDCDCGKTWSSYMATLKVDLYLKGITWIYKQACKSCGEWVSPSFQLEDVMERVITKYYERQKLLASGKAFGDNTLVDSDLRRGNAQGPYHEQSLCERCQEMGKPCWG